MKKLKNILAENMRRFGTKNLNEDEDQNNNGYPDNTEGTNAFSVLIDALETNLASYTADEITYEADDDIMEVHVDIYSTENKKQITKIINNTVNANTTFMIDKQSITREKDTVAEFGGLMLSFDIIKK
jgi:hypothetical protein